jgi:hypothetical protein
LALTLPNYDVVLEDFSHRDVRRGATAGRLQTVIGALTAPTSLWHLCASEGSRPQHHKRTSALSRVGRQQLSNLAHAGRKTKMRDIRSA